MIVPRSSHSAAAWQLAAVLACASLAAAQLLHCIAPLAGIGAAAAIALPRRRDALAITAAAWLANQLYGFGVLGYPRDASTVLAGISLGLGALAAALIASALRKSLFAAFFASFAAYEAIVFLFSLIVGGTAGFTAPIIAYVLAVNLAFFAALIAIAAVTLRLLQRARTLSQ